MLALLSYLLAAYICFTFMGVFGVIVLAPFLAVPFFFIGAMFTGMLK